MFRHRSPGGINWQNLLCNVRSLELADVGLGRKAERSYGDSLKEVVVV